MELIISNTESCHMNSLTKQLLKIRGEEQKEEKVFSK